MTGDDFVAVLPMLITAAAGVAVLLAVAIRRSHAAALGIAIIGLSAALASTIPAGRWVPRAVTPLLIIDGQALFFSGLFLAAAAIVTLMSYSYLAGRAEIREEYYVLVILATLGAMILSASSHFSSLFLGVELMSVSLYGLLAYCRRSALSIEVGLKYLLMAGASSAFVLFGIALIYGQSGSMSPAALGGEAKWNALILVGLAMILVGLGFKLSLAPFHAWAPDVYQGSPLPATAVLATISKGAILSLLLRYFRMMGLHTQPSAVQTIAALAAISMFAGNLLALLQSNLKRILAGSSIAHMGYLIVALLAGGDLAIVAVGLYLIVYFATMLGAFGAAMALSGRDRERQDLDEYRGLARQSPVLAGVMTAAFLSLAGIPLTGGFFGKFTIFAAAARSHLWWLLIVIVMNSGIGLFYYLRIIRTFFEPGGLAASPSTDWLTRISVAISLAAVIWIGIWPAPLLKLLQGIHALAG